MIALKGIRPVLELPGSQLQMLATGTTDDLIRTLLPLVQARTGSRNAVPLLLLNGRRQILQRDIADIPIEAVQRVEVFAPPAATAFGGDADKVVINYVTAKTFSKDDLHADLNYNTNTRSALQMAEYSHFRLAHDSRTTFGAEAAYSILEGQSRTDRFDAPNLVSSTMRGAVSFRHARTVPAIGSVQIAATAGFDRDARQIFSGADDNSNAKELNRLRTAHVELGLNSLVGQWEVLSSVIWDWRRNALSVVESPGQHLENHYLESRIEADGPLFKMGQVQVTGTGAAYYSVLDSNRRFGADKDQRRKSQWGSRGGIRLPLVFDDRGGSKLDLSGGLIANGFDDSALRLGWYLTGAWLPLPPLRLNVSMEQDPAVNGMDASLSIETTRLSVPYYDYLRKQIVRVDLIGGKADPLPASRTKSLRVTGSYSDIAGLPLFLTMNWTRQSSTSNRISLADPNPVTQILAPERFFRDATGHLTGVDIRPLLAEARHRSELMISLSTFFMLGKLPSGPNAPSPWAIMAAASVTQSLDDCLTIHDRTRICGADAAIAVEGATASPREVRFDASMTSNGSGVGMDLSFREKTKIADIMGQDFSRPTRALLSFSLSHCFGELPPPGKVDRRLRVKLAVSDICLSCAGVRRDDLSTFRPPQTYLLSLRKAI